jgi:hypothetical protein
MITGRRSRESNLGPPEYEAGMLTCRLRRPEQILIRKTLRLFEKLELKCEDNIKMCLTEIVYQIPGVHNRV